MERINVHATALVAGRAGILIRGASGSGKSRLALGLIELCYARCRFASLVADDRVWLTARGGRLIADAPEPLAGLVELRGFGPSRIDHEPRAVVDLVVALVEPDVAPRHREEAEELLLGLALPRLDLPARDERGATRAVAAWLGL